MGNAKIEILGIQAINLTKCSRNSAPRVKITLTALLEKGSKILRLKVVL